MTTRRPPPKGIDQNTLFTGDNLYILNGMNSESVDLIYLDPPFNSKRFYSAPIGSKAAGTSFKDMWTWKDVDEAYLERMVNDYPYLVQFVEAVEMLHSKPMMAYLTYMTQRILEMYRVLKSTGTFYLHCDSTASHYLKIILDRVFGKGNFLNEIIWKYGLGGSSPKMYSRKHDIILFYAKSKNYHFDKPKVDATSARMKGQKKGMPDVWTDIPTINNMAKERTGYPTQKPLALLRRVVEASSNRGDVVLDPFCGCATTMVAAQQLERKWIGIDIEEKSAELVVERLSDDAGLFSDFVHRHDIPVRTDIEITDIVDVKNKKRVKEKLGKQYGKVCNACGMSHYENLEIDHVVPKSKGGQDTYSNYQLLCGNCNRTKGNRPMEYLMDKIAKREKLLRRKITFGKKA